MTIWTVLDSCCLAYTPLEISPSFSAVFPRRPVPHQSLSSLQSAYLSALTAGASSQSRWGQGRAEMPRDVGRELHEHRPAGVHVDEVIPGSIRKSGAGQKQVSGGLGWDWWSWREGKRGSDQA